MKAVEAAGYSTQTMLVITEPAEEGKRAAFIPYGPVAAGKVITR